MDILVPSIGESITEVSLSKWLVADGEFVSLDQPICEFESDKATFELPAERAGKLQHLAKEGQDLAIGAVVARIDSSVKSAEPVHAISDISPTITQTTSELPAAPAAAKLMREAGISPKDIEGTGKEGRITKADVLESLTNRSHTAAQETAAQDHIPHPLSALPGRSQHREKMSRMRRTIARRLVSAKNETAMLTTFNEVDMSKLMELRQLHQESFVAKHGIKLGFMSFFAKACAQVLFEMPEVNAHIDGEELIYHDYVDLAMAISTPTGLVVPPIRNVEKLQLHEFEKQLKDLAEKARTGKLSLEEMSGGTFTITNGGVFGSLMSTPILNEPQSAILGLHAIKDRPVAINGQVVIRPMMYIALSYDHRVIDGSSSVRFLVRVKELIEDPLKLFLSI